ncbi:MAG: hypothetical protein H0W45_10690 [Acidobacteria bacterium]|nr:hypothetical protein [Acidobacteriota bacterium]
MKFKIFPPIRLLSWYKSVSRANIPNENYCDNLPPLFLLTAARCRRANSGILKNACKSGCFSLEHALQAFIWFEKKLPSDMKRFR